MQRPVKRASLYRRITAFTGEIFDHWSRDDVPRLSASLAYYAILSSAPLLVLWFFSPALAWWLSRDIAPAPVRLSDEQQLFLQKLSRRTWRYFEECVNAEDNCRGPGNPSRPLRPHPGDQQNGAAGGGQQHEGQVRH